MDLSTILRPRMGDGVERRAWLPHLTDPSLLVNLNKEDSKYTVRKLKLYFAECIPGLSLALLDLQRYRARARTTKYTPTKSEHILTVYTVRLQANVQCRHHRSDAAPRITWETKRWR